MTTAIRLDGSSAATLAFNGTVRNPNPWPGSLYTGTVRHVAYAVGITT